jgi:hypothetical protein
MTVYVDDMRREACVGKTRGRWSHLMADTTEELHAFARQLGLIQTWVQAEGTCREHYDITESVRKQALKLGAQPLSYPRETGTLVARKRSEAAS